MKGFISSYDFINNAKEDRGFLQLYGGACIFKRRDKPISPESLTHSC